MSWEPLGDKGEAGPGLRAGILHMFAAPEVPRNRDISGEVSHTTSKNSLVFSRKINVSKYYLPALFLNWFGAQVKRLKVLPLDLK